MNIESSQEREATAARLQDMSTRQSERLATKSSQERGARLQDMSARQRERLATESSQEREARLPSFERAKTNARSEHVLSLMRMRF